MGLTVTVGRGVAEPGVAFLGMEPGPDRGVFRGELFWLSLMTHP